MTVTLTITLALLGITFAGMCVRSKMGFGFSLLTVPAASLVIGFRGAVQFSIVVEVASGLAMVWLLRTEIRLRDAAILKVGSLFGLGVASILSSYVSRTIIASGSMLIVITTCIILLSGFHTRRDAPAPSVIALPNIGCLSGMLNYWTSLSGPPVVLAYARSRLPEAKIVAILSGYFFLLYLATFSSMALQGEYSDFRYWPAAALCSVGALVGTRLVRRLVNRIVIDFHRVAIVAILLSSVVVLLRVLTAGAGA